MQQIIEPLWQVRLEVIKDQAYCHKGQILDEIVMASDKEKAVEKVLLANEIDEWNTSLKGVRKWNPDEQTI